MAAYLFDVAGIGNVTGVRPVNLEANSPYDGARARYSTTTGVLIRCAVNLSAKRRPGGGQTPEPRCVRPGRFHVRLDDGRKRLRWHCHPDEVWNLQEKHRRRGHAARGAEHFGA